MRYAAGVEYCGTRYSGWQRQHHALTVQGELERALSTVADHPVETVCAGRTDAGVHGLGQVVHFDSDAERDEKAWCFGTNTHLPADISLRWIQPVDADFSARYSALSRRYRYLILDSRNRSGLFADRVCWSRSSLDADLMLQAAQGLLGEHDFSSFRAAECQSNTPVREVLFVDVRRHRELVCIDVEANAFVHHMVRNIAGVLMMIGRGQRPVQWVDELLRVRDRRQGGVTAPAHALYFLTVRYPEPNTFPSASNTLLLSH